MFDINSWILTILIAVPLAGALLIALLPRGIARYGALAIAVLNFVLSLYLLANWSKAASGYHFEQSLYWVPQLGIKYHVGVDGLSLFLILLTTFLTPLCLLASWTEITKRPKEFAVCLLLLEGIVVGVFAALDVILFYIFWEAVLVPMALLIGIWGGPRRVQAAMKFFLYTMAGSVLLWVAALLVYFKPVTGVVSSFDYQPFGDAARALDATDPHIALWLFAAFAVAFAIKVPLFPLHTWLPAAYTQAPTAGTVMLAAVLSKMGLYGFIRFAVPFFPNAANTAAPLMCALAIVAIIYGALVAVRQTDFKQLIAYSSISHLGFVVLGVFVSLLANNYADVALTGATLQMVAHGLSTGALFLLAGFLEERRRTREIGDYGGLAAVMPRYTVLLWIAVFAAIGLPGLSGFVGEYLILQGAMSAGFWYAATAATGIILGAVYMLRMVRSLLFGELTREENKVLKDVNARELFVVTAVLAVTVWIGVQPQPFLNIINANTKSVLEIARGEEDDQAGALKLAER
ncbi:MAG TPA: NADH-quinone oxidoreductase subunit M [Abditibacteriaceae bacterium]|nr:NADH-quinone oxidoreductase subunit M [Abditibacteriaceae bacterium]